MKVEPSSPATTSAPSARDAAAERRAWDLLGHASAPEISTDFATKVATVAAKVPQVTRPSVILRWVRIGLPLAAAALIALSFGMDRFLAPPPGPEQTSQSLPGADSATNLAELARMEAALNLLPEDPELAPFNPGALELASVDDLAEITDDQILSLLY